MSKIVITNVNANKKEFSKETKQTFSGVEMVNGILVRNLDEFETKESLEEYGLNFGINLNRKYSLDNMKKQLSEHIEGLKSLK